MTSKDYLQALLHGTIEIWESDSFLNPEKVTILVHGKKRFDARTEKRITRKELEKRYSLKIDQKKLNRDATN